MDNVQGCRRGRNAQCGCRESGDESGKALQRRKHLGRVFKKGLQGGKGHAHRHGEAQ